MKTKKFYKTMKLENSELNKIYNFQDTVILCSSHLQVHSVFCVHRDKNKRCIALPTDAEHVRVFEKTLTGDALAV